MLNVSKMDFTCAASITKLTELAHCFISRLTQVCMRGDLSASLLEPSWSLTRRGVICFP